MKEYIFNEKSKIEDIMRRKEVNQNNPTYTIRSLARYNHYVLNLSKNKSYDNIVDYMSKYCREFSEFAYQKDIFGCIRDVEKTAWKDIEFIDIRKSEMDFIDNLDDIKKRKIAFVLLCTAKYRDYYNPDNDHKTDIGSSDLYKKARVVLPKDERLLYLHFLITDNVIEKHSYAKTKNKKVLFVSDDINDPIVLRLKEVDFLELAYVYLDYESDHVGYDRCQKCGRIFKKSKTKPRKYCLECATHCDKVNFKTIKCVDCGKEIEVPIKDNNTTRCRECYYEHRKENVRENVRKFREKHK